jgi:hypothetical protein
MRFTIIALVLLLSLPPWAAGAWLDDTPPLNWNKGGPVPRAPTGTGHDDPRCRRLERPAETSEDRAVVAAGWRLFREYQGGWGTMVVWGLTTYDGMCRPNDYQVFVFLRNAFAGTLSPMPMTARADGSLFSVTLIGSPDDPGADVLSAMFVRYADSDPLCCPSARTIVRYRLNASGSGRVISPVGHETSSTVP